MMNQTTRTLATLFILGAVLSSLFLHNFGAAAKQRKQFAEQQAHFDKLQIQFERQNELFQRIGEARTAREKLFRDAVMRVFEKHRAVMLENIGGANAEHQAVEAQIWLDLGRDLERIIELYEAPVEKGPDA